jgi:hypothetical protein
MTVYFVRLSKPLLELSSLYCSWAPGWQRLRSMTSDPKPITLLTLIGSYTPQMLRFQIPTHRPVCGEGITCQFFTSVLGFPPQLAW